VPAVLYGSSLNTPDADTFEGRMVPGAPAADAPVLRAGGHPGWLLRELDGEFTVLVYGDGNQQAQIDRLAAELHDAAEGLVPLKVLRVAAQGSTPAARGDSVVDQQGLIAQRYDLKPGNAVLLRPDQHVCARWRAPNADKLRAALNTAIARH
jgi:3-(3-hydroxy-phenyl)propionate hydroxylase